MQTVRRVFIALGVLYIFVVYTHLTDLNPLWLWRAYAEFWGRVWAAFNPLAALFSIFLVALLVMTLVAREERERSTAPRPR